ncbi:MAG: N-acetylmuramoyl-L-alanine amidase family protein [Methylococcaceae bacterium]
MSGINLFSGFFIVQEAFAQKSMKHYVLYGLTLALLLVAAKHSMANKPALLAIDAGHSKQHPGAISASGKPEFEFNADLSASLQILLASHSARFVDISENGNTVDLPARTRFASAAGATFFLSIHHDSVQPQYLKSWQSQGITRQHSNHASGFSLFVSRKNPQFNASLQCASAIGSALKQKGLHPSPHHAETIAGESREWADQNNGVYYYDNLVVLKTAAMPAVLLEAGVIVNRDEEQRLQKSETRDTIAGAIEKGLFNCGVLK